MLRFVLHSFAEQCICVVVLHGQSVFIFLPVWSIISLGQNRYVDVLYFSLLSSVLAKATKWLIPVTRQHLSREAKGYISSKCFIDRKRFAWKYRQQHTESKCSHAEAKCECVVPCMENSSSGQVLLFVKHGGLLFYFTWCRHVYSFAGFGSVKAYRIGWIWFCCYVRFIMHN